MNREGGEIFDYGHKQTRWLSDRDPVLGSFIAQTGNIRRRVYPDAFTGLARAIIGQQISSKAQDAIWTRFRQKFSPAEPETIACANPEDLRACGISGRKCACLVSIAGKFASGELNHDNLARMPDQALEEKLTSLAGVGKWTAEMLLIFTFRRQNILSFGDLAIRRGLCALYGLETITKSDFERFFSLYSPWATIASFYIWEAASQSKSVPKPAKS